MWGTTNTKTLADKYTLGHDNLNNVPYICCNNGVYLTKNHVVTFFIFFKESQNNQACFSLVRFWQFETDAGNGVKFKL